MAAKLNVLKGKSSGTYKYGVYGIIVGDWQSQTVLQNLNVLGSAILGAMTLSHSDAT